MKTDSPGLAPYHAKVTTAEAAARLIKPGDHVFVGTACATPRALVKAIEDLAKPPADVEFIHFITTGAFHSNENGDVTTRYRHRTFFVGSDMRKAVQQGLAEYVPLSIARVSELFTIGRIPLDVALIPQVGG